MNSIWNDNFIKKFNSLEGWFLKEAALTWDCLLNYQNTNSIAGNFLEIGVYKGKSAILQCLHAAEQEICLFVDQGMYEETQVLLRGLHANSNFYRCRSQSLLRHGFDLANFSASCRWVHIDGGHSASACSYDLHIGDQVLSEDGIICVDDFFNSSYPQVTAAVFDYLNKNPFSLKLFLCGFNKGYLARPYYCDYYLRYLLRDFHKDLRQRNYQNKISLVKTSMPSDFNCFGMSDYQGKDLIGLDEDRNKVLI